MNLGVQRLALFRHRTGVSHTSLSRGHHFAQRRTLAQEKTTKVQDKFTVGKDGQIKVEFGKKSFEMHKCDGPPNSVETTKDELLKYFQQMSYMRRVEVTCDNLYKNREIRGFLHLYNGQEAIVAGCESVIERDDHVITAYRDHAHYIGRGGTAFEVIAELMGKVGGSAAGKGGSMHLYKKDSNFHGGNGIVGAQVPIGAGIAYAQKYLNTGKICLTFYGDGAANQGQVFEAYNMAALWKLPVLFICENNKFGMGTSIQRSSASTEYYKRGDFIPGLKIDAMNVLAVKAGMAYASDFTRTGNGPMVLEMETYRYMGHSMSDPGLSYRTREEVSAVRAEKDPIDRVRYYLIENNLATEEELKEIEKSIKKEVDEAVKQAKAAPSPELKELYTDVYTPDSKPYYVRAVELDNSVIVE